MMSVSRSKQLVSRREGEDDDDDAEEEEEVQRLRDEVLYLHSLWHQGPPPPKPSFSISIPSYSSPSKYKAKTITKPKPKPKPSHSSSSSSILHLVSKPQPFKTTKKTTPTLQVHDPIGVTSSSSAGLVQWPCPSQSSTTSSAWPSWHPPIITPPQQPPLPLATLPSTSIALQLQRQFVQESRKFLTAQEGDGDGDDDDDDDDSQDQEDDDDDDPMAEPGLDQCPEFKFFSRLFEEEEGKELRDYYANHRESGGELCCLVCGGIGKKGWKRFNSCLALLQHALTVSNTKKKRAHRAFGQVICKVLGLDVARFPAIVLHPQQKQPGDPNTSILQRSGLNDDAKPSNEVSNRTINNSESVPSNDEKLVAEEDSRLHPNAAMLTSSLHQDDVGKCASSVRKERSISDKAEAVGCNTNLQNDGRSYKKQNVEFWVNNHCWPEERLNASMLRSCSQKKASESDLTEDHIPN